MFFAQIHQESRFNEEAKSVHAEGIAQFTVPTASDAQRLFPSDLKEFCDLSGGCPLDVRWALRAMVLWDRRLYNGRSFANGDDRWGFTLADYNGALDGSTASVERAPPRRHAIRTPTSALFSLPAALARQSSAALQHAARTCVIRARSFENGGLSTTDGCSGDSGGWLDDLRLTSMASSARTDDLATELAYDGFRVCALDRYTQGA